MQINQQLIGGRYLLLDLIGAGGMGKVYRAHDRLTDSPVALKQVTVPTNQLNTNSVPDSRQQSQLTLASEFHTLASLRHPHIISVLDYGFDEEHLPYFTMELLDNAQTVTAVAQGVEHDIKLSLIVQMLQALSYLHRRGIIHRDLKPDNVLVTRNGDGQYNVKVLDFGLASTPDFASASGSIVGTLAYLAPEILQGHTIGRYSDLYAVGMMMYEILAGKYPFDTTQITDLMQSILYFKPRTNIPGIERPMASILRRLLEKSPEKRYSDAESLLTAISEISEIDIATENVAVRESFLQAAKFVGRETEFNRLRSALMQTRQGRGSLWLVGGESGVGKSRLLDELRTVALVEGVLVLRGQAISDGGMPYQLWRDVIRRLVLSTDVNGEQASVLKEIVPDIERLLDQKVTDAPQLSETAQKERLTDTIVQLISQQTNPILLLLEDLHWATDSLDPVLQLTGKIDHLPVCVVGAYRSDEQPDVSELLTDAKCLVLARLNRNEIADLSISMVGSAAGQPGVMELVERETEGNTFFIVEVMRALAEDAGQLDNIGRVTLPASVITGGIHAVIQRRMNRVSREYHGLLSLAAVAGRQLDLVLLQHILKDQSDFSGFLLDEWLSACESAAVIGVQDGQWRFSHDKLREHLLQQLEDKRQMHRIVAKAIEAIYPDDTARYASLSQHWLMAEDYQKAIRYAIPAARQMKNVSNYQAATDLLYSITVGWDQELIDTEVQCDFFIRLGELNERLGEYTIAGDYFERSFRLATDLHDPSRIAEALLGQGTIAYDQGNYDVALEKLYAALNTGKDIATNEILALVYKLISNVLSQQDNFTESNRYLEKALEYSREAGSQIEVAGCLNNLGVNEYLRGDYDAARDYYRQALDVYIDAGYRSGIALCMSNLGDVAFDEGYEKQIEYYEKGLSIYRDIGNQWGIALCLENAASTYYMLHRYDEAIKAYQDGLTISRKIGDKHAMQYTLMQLGLIYNLQGDYVKSGEMIDESLILSRELNAPSAQVTCLSYSAFNDIDLNLLDHAMMKLVDALQIASRGETKIFKLDILATYARLLLVQESYQTSLILCEYLLAHPSVEDVTRQFIIVPVYERVKTFVSEVDYQHAVTIAQTLNVDSAVQLMNIEH